MNYLIDTCVISELFKSKPSENVINWISSINEDNLFISVLTLGEIRKGIVKLPKSKKKKDLQIWFIELENRFQSRTVSIDTNIAETWGKIQGELELSGKSLPTIDSLIASTAIAKDLIIVTRNISDMKNSGAELLNPWEK